MKLLVLSVVALRMGLYRSAADLPLWCGPAAPRSGTAAGPPPSASSASSVAASSSSAGPSSSSSAASAAPAPGGLEDVSKTFEDAARQAQQASSAHSFRLGR